MGLRDTINDKFGWSRKQSSLTLSLKGFMGVVILIIGLNKTTGSFSYLDDCVAKIFEPIESVHTNNRDVINYFILASTRIEQLLMRLFMNFLSLLVFYPAFFLVAVGALAFITAYMTITKFSEDASWSAEKSNHDAD
jgi:hypothetical protein